MAQRNKKGNTVIIHVRISADMKETLEDIAEKDHRNLTSLVNKMLDERLKQMLGSQQEGAAA